MSDGPQVADRSFKRASEFFYALARKRNLGIGLGRLDHPVIGPMRVIAVYGWVGQLFVTLVVGGREPLLALEQFRLWWYLSDRAETFEFKHVGSRLRRPMSELTVRGMFAMQKAAVERLNWLKGRASLEDVLSDLFERNIAPVVLADEAASDVRIALAEELPKGDEEEP